MASVANISFFCVKQKRKMTLSRSWGVNCKKRLMRKKANYALRAKNFYQRDVQLCAKLCSRIIAW